MGAPRPWKEGRSCETPYVYNDLGVNEIRLAQVVVPQCQIWGDDDAIEGKQPLASSASETQLFPYRRQSNASPNGIDGLRPCWQTNHCSMHPSPKVNVPPNTIHLGVVVFGVLSVVEMTQSRDSVLQSSQPAVLYSEGGSFMHTNGFASCQKDVTRDRDQHRAFSIWEGTQTTTCAHQNALRVTQ